MKVILLKDVKGVGKRFEEKQVSDGHAINYLIPKKLAVSASGSGAAQVKALKAQEESGKAIKSKKSEEEIGKLAGTEVTVSVRANEKGHLFAALSAEKIAELLSERGIEVDFTYINLFEGIREVGSYRIPVKVGEKETHFTLIVEALKK